MEGYSIKEVIVVEGTCDVLAVKRDFKGKAECVATHGLGIRQELLERLEAINERQGIIVLTDPDYAGKRIRQKIRDYIPSAKHAYISREEGILGDDIGVENASDQAIIKAINKAKPELEKAEDLFLYEDIVDLGLTGLPDSKKRRIALCDALKIEYSNAKQLVSRLNIYGVTREEFVEALKEIDEKR